MDKFKILIVLLLIVLAFNIYFASQLMAILKNQNPTVPAGTPLNITSTSSITPSIIYKDSMKSINIKVVENIDIKKDGKYTFYYTLMDQRIVNSSILLIFYNTEDDEVSATLQLFKSSPYGTVELDKGSYEVIIYINIVTSNNLTANDILSSLKITYDLSK